MKLICSLLFLIWTISPIAGQENVLQKKINLYAEDQSIAEVLEGIERKAAVKLSYSSLVVPRPKARIKLMLKQRSLESALKEILGENVQFQVIGNHIIIGPALREEKPVYTISGYLQDAQNGEALIGATLQIRELPSVGVASNAYGFYSLSLPAGSYHIICSFIGYEELSTPITLNKSQNINLALQPASKDLTEVIIYGAPTEQEPLSGRGTGNRLDLQQLKSMPAIAGEPDLFKLVQTRPGVKSVDEGSSGLYVRGGNIDQNLILLDEAPVYNPAHFLGFFSAFNPDAIRHAQLHKSNFPIQYGGRLSSVFDLRMKEGNKEQTSMQGGIGLLASRFTVEGPIQKQKSSYMFSSRRTYPDLLFALIPDDGGNKAHFYDLNVKINGRLGPKDHLYLSSYLGRDVFRYFDQYENDWSNATLSLRWNHLFNDHLFSNFSLIGSRYRYFIDNFIQGETTFNWQSGITNLNAKADFSWYPKAGSTWRFGLNILNIQFDPGSDTEQRVKAVSPRQALESSVYLGHEWTPAEGLHIQSGLRFNFFQNLGPALEYQFGDRYELIDSTYYRSGSYGQFGGLAPRLYIRYQLSEKSALTAAYNRSYQYIQELRNASSSFSAFYIWLPSGPNLPAQAADQVSAAYLRQLAGGKLSFSLELYYKRLYRQVDFADHAQLLQNPYLEGEIRVGKGQAYGLEVQLQKTGDRLSGWINYTFARTFRSIPEINGGREYPAYHDLPHAVNLNLQYKPAGRWRLAINWQYTSGKPAILPTGSYRIGETIVPIYGDRNSRRLPAFHRLDLSASLQRRDKPGVRNHSHWVFSIHNVYYRKNALGVDLLPWRDPLSGNVPDPTDVRAYKTFIFGVLPSIAYNFKF